MFLRAPSRILNFNPLLPQRTSPRRSTSGQTKLNVYKLNPLEHPPWGRFVACHPLSSAFHSTGWLTALQRTYGYEPVVYTIIPASTELENGIVFCRVKSWLSGFRLVSLPFSDHCQPLVDDPGVLHHLAIFRSIRSFHAEAVLNREDPIPGLVEFVLIPY